MTNIDTLSTKELVAVYNAHSGKAPITAWKRKVSELKAAVMKLCPDTYFAGPLPSRAGEDFEAPTAELSKQSGRPVDADESKPERRKTTKKVADKPKSDRGAIRRYTEELLLQTKGTDPETKKPLGLPYATILEKVQAKFPEAQTSLNCLRWYATKMNKRTGKEAVRMPLRPKAEKTAEAA